LPNHRLPVAGDPDDGGIARRGTADNGQQQFGGLDVFDGVEKTPDVVGGFDAAVVADALKNAAGTGGAEDR
jgi:hypothetical protein